MVVHTTRSGQVNLGSVNIKKENPDKNGWIQKSRKDIPALEANLNDEVKAIAQYQEHIENTDDPKTAALLDHIKGEEEGHAKELRDAIESNKKTGETLEVEKAIGKPYSQQPGRQHGKGPGHIVGHPGREDEPMIPQDLDEEMKQAIERDVEGEGKKRFKVQYNIGTAKYVINFHDGVKKHEDGSDFYDIAIFHNKKDLEQALNDLRGKGYKEEGITLGVKPFAETGGVLDTSKVADVEMEDIDIHDYPDFSDAFISDASYQMADGTYRQMTDEELEILNEDSDFVYNSIPDDVMSGGE